MFDANIKYYAYDNIDGDDFGVGYLGNKEWWINIINRWSKEDGKDSVYTIEDWDELDFANDFRGILLAEVVPDDKDYLVTWVAKNSENCVKINKKGEFSWEENPTKITSVPRWISRLKRTIKEYKIA